MIQHPRISLSENFIKTRTFSAKKRMSSFLKQARNLATDPQKHQRLAVQECIWCFYREEMVNRAPSSRPCATCHHVIPATNESVDILCMNCANERNLCKHCGADINLEFP